MSSSHKLSLQAAILMNLNIMAGAGIFINIVKLTDKLGLAGGLLYLGVGLFMFPLIFTFAQLVKVYPSGGFYAFAAPMSPFLAFISTWTYFFGKLASASLLLHVAATFLQTLLSQLLGDIPTVCISLSILALFMYLNSLNLRIGEIIQRCFFVAKSLPMILMIALGIYHFDINIISDAPSIPYPSFIIMLPLVLYCFSGFEAACSISRNIQNAEINAPKAIFYSFFSIISLYVAFQTLTSMILLPKISALASHQNGYTLAYPYLTSLIPLNSWFQAKIATMISFLIGFSAMGAAYGLLFSNSWNLYTLAQNGHTFASKKLSSLNEHGIPLFAVLTEGLICAIFLIITLGNPIPLMQTSTLGCTLTYTISSIAFLKLSLTHRLVGILSLLTCSGFITSCIMSSIQYNFTSLQLFTCMFLLGMLMYGCCYKK